MKMYQVERLTYVDSGEWAGWFYDGPHYVVFRSPSEWAANVAQRWFSFFADAAHRYQVVRTE